MNDENQGDSRHASGGGRAVGGVLAGCCSLGCLTQAVSFGRLLSFVKPRLRLEQCSQANALPLSPTVLTGAQHVAKSAIPAVCAAALGRLQSLPSLSQALIHAVGSSVNIGQ